MISLVAHSVGLALALLLALVVGIISFLWELYHQHQLRKAKLELRLRQQRKQP